jgi:hypothetical protein
MTLLMDVMCRNVRYLDRAAKGSIVVKESALGSVDQVTVT